MNILLKKIKKLLKDSKVETEKKNEIRMKEIEQKNELRIKELEDKFAL